MGRRSRGGAMALREFVIDEGARDRPVLYIVCRARGLRALIRAMLRLDPYIYLSVDRRQVEFKELSLFREEYHTIPLRAVAGVRGGFTRPFGRLVAAIAFLVLALAWGVIDTAYAWERDLGQAMVDSGNSRTARLVLENDTALALVLAALLVIAALWQLWRYSRDKQFFFAFEYGERSPRGMLADRSVTKYIDLTEVRRAARVVSDLVLGVGDQSDLSPVAVPPD